MIIFDLPREKHAKTTLFVNIETEIANFENRRGKWKVKSESPVSYWLNDSTPAGSIMLVFYVYLQKNTN
jgi:hypothetical protein